MTTERVTCDGADADRANHDAEEDGAWPHPRRRLVDALWAFGLHALPAVYAATTGATGAEGADGGTQSTRSMLTGPGFEPWRPLLATARVVEDAGVAGLVERIRALAHAYQAERADLEYPDATRLAVLAVAELADLSDTRTREDGKDTLDETPAQTMQSTWWDTPVRCTAQEVTQRVNAAARELGLTDPDTDFTTATKIGRTLNTLRIKARRVAGKQRTREREITRRAAYQLLCAYAPAAPETTRAGTAPPEPSVQQVSLPSASVLVSDAKDPWAEPAAGALTRLAAARPPLRTEPSLGEGTRGEGPPGRCRVCGGGLATAESQEAGVCGLCRRAGLAPERADDAAGGAA